MQRRRPGRLGGPHHFWSGGELPEGTWRGPRLPGRRRCHASRAARPAAPMLTITRRRPAQPAGSPPGAPAGNLPHELHTACIPPPHGRTQLGSLLGQRRGACAPGKTANGIPDFLIGLRGGRCHRRPVPGANWRGAACASRGHALAQQGACRGSVAGRAVGDCRGARALLGTDYGFRRLDILEPGRECLMSRDWRCLIGWHDWREVEMPDRDKCAECTRCGTRDWRRLLPHTSSKWRGGDPPPGSGGGW